MSGTPGPLLRCQAAVVQHACGRVLTGHICLHVSGICVVIVVHLCLMCHTLRLRSIGFIVYSVGKPLDPFLQKNY